MTYTSLFLPHYLFSFFSLTPYQNPLTAWWHLTVRAWNAQSCSFSCKWSWLTRGPKKVTSRLKMAQWPRLSLRSAMNWVCQCHVHLQIPSLYNLPYTVHSGFSVTGCGSQSHMGGLERYSSLFLNGTAFGKMSKSCDLVLNKHEIKYTGMTGFLIIFNRKNNAFFFVCV